MSVERRYCARLPIDLQVQILYRKRRFCSATARNLSNQGMLLDVRNVTLPTGTLIELEFQALGRHWLIPAIVVHHHGGGVGVMFRDEHNTLYQDLPRRPAAELPAQASAATARLHLSSY
ncbi:pilus biosynthesis protein PilZ [Marichromatium purpuratum 984]|uniref:Pilus biosynthesis protein PilZ n=1 Tax=Marichromatium purpuratum 984 TaxID=765910 RepID=W0E151_MARPU|nr:PilZ domain-containing protein [Marichromatium purpuratum]AHF04605.1 pilus biosynthesis protein PilZ [Marichromatium purpuratum 984]